MNILFALVRKPKTSQFGIVQCPFHLFISNFQPTKYNFQLPELDDGNICWRPPLDLMAILALGVSVKHQKSVQWLDHGWTSRLVNLRFLSSLTPKLIVFFEGTFFSGHLWICVFSHGIPVSPTQIAVFLRSPWSWWESRTQLVPTVYMGLKMAERVCR